MKNAPTGIGRELSRLFRAGTTSGTTDGELLERFVYGDDESAALAFETIVERHGPMVLRVCRTVLRDVHAAEDAFQATFLVLARKARGLGSKDLLGNWLYGVAARTARKARALAARRQAGDRHAAFLRQVAVEELPHDQSQAELERILHDEIGRLPSSYRATIVACYLEGLSHGQAAQRLRLSESTLRGRLARARKLLGRRLIRRGVVPATGLAALGNTADAALRLSAAMAQATAHAAFVFVNRGQAIPGAALATAQGIANGVLSTMWFSSFKTLAVTLLACGLVGVGTSSLLARRGPLQDIRPLGAGGQATAPPEAVNPELVKLAQGKIVRTVPVQDIVKDIRPLGAGGQATAPPEAANPELVKLARGKIVRTVPVSKDCMVLAYMPDWNFGNVDNIGIGNNNGGVRTLLDWPAISPEEAAAPDRRYLLALYSRSTHSGAPASAIVAFEILEDWPERTSWDTQPRYEAEPAANFKFEPGNGWKLLDVTPLVRTRAKAGRTSHGILLRFLKENASGREVSDYQMVSREGRVEWANRQPVLLVVSRTN